VFSFSRKAFRVGRLAFKKRKTEKDPKNDKFAGLSLIFFSSIVPHLISNGQFTYFLLKRKKYGNKQILKVGLSK